MRRGYALRTTALIAALFTGACASGGGEKIDYGAAMLPPLEVPPDLVKPADNTPAVDLAAATQSSVAPDVAGVEVRQDGALRWLYVPQRPEVVWPKLREFFLKTGLKIAVEDPTLGIMETEWAENRANVDNGFFQRTLGKVMPSLFSNNERDRYRARVERVDNGTGGTEIFLTHRGMEEVLVGGNSAVNVTQSAWQRRPTDPELEAEMLRRLMLFLGAPAGNAQALQAKATPRAQLLTDADGGLALQLTDRVDTAWLRVGVALDRLGYVVKARDDASKTYTLRYVDPNAAEEEKGIWSGGNTARKSEARDVVVQLQGDSDTTRLRLRAEAASLAPAEARALLQALESQLQ